MRSTFGQRSLLVAQLFVVSLVAGCGPQGSPVPPSAAVRVVAPAFRFLDVTRTAGIVWQRSNGAFGKKWMPETLGGGGAFLDYDNDGYQDILLINGDSWPGHSIGARPTPALYHNNRDGTFKDVTADVGLNVHIQGMGVAIGDFDNDGYDDILITGVGGNHLFHNEGGKRFVDVTAQSGVAGAGWSTSAAWVDYDNDGRLDLFVCHYVRWTPQTDLPCGGQAKSYCTPVHYQGESCRLYHNDGSGRFTDVTDRAGIRNDNSKALGVCTIDYDGDGLTDIIVANDLAPNFVYHNEGNGHFKDVALETGLGLGEGGEARAGMGIDVADLGNDGTTTVLVGNFSTQGVGLFHAAQPGVFRDAAIQANLVQPTSPYVTFGVLFCDFSNSGWKDVVIANGHVDDHIHDKEPAENYKQPPQLFANLHDGTFAEAGTAAGAEFAEPMVGRGACWGDFDNDGRPDLLLIPNIGAPRLLHNETAGNGHWISFALEGVSCNRDGYGARVKVIAGHVSQTDTARSGSSYCSQSDRRLHFGLADRLAVDSIEVRWPGGHVDTWRNVPADRIYRLKEGSPPMPAMPAR